MPPVVAPPPRHAAVLANDNVQGLLLACRMVDDGSYCRVRCSIGGPLCYLLEDNKHTGVLSIEDGYGRLRQVKTRVMRRGSNSTSTQAEEDASARDVLWLCDWRDTDSAWFALKECHYVFQMSKATDSRTVAMWLVEVCRDDAVIVSLQSGLNNCRELRKVFGRREFDPNAWGGGSGMTLFAPQPINKSVFSSSALTSAAVPVAATTTTRERKDSAGSTGGISSATEDDDDVSSVVSGASADHAPPPSPQKSHHPQPLPPRISLISSARQLRRRKRRHSRASSSSSPVASEAATVNAHPDDNEDENHSAAASFADEDDDDEEDEELDDDGEKKPGVTILAGVVGFGACAVPSSSSSTGATAVLLTHHGNIVLERLSKPNSLQCLPCVLLLERTMFTVKYRPMEEMPNWLWGDLVWRTFETYAAALLVPRYSLYGLLSSADDVHRRVLAGLLQESMAALTGQRVELIDPAASPLGGGLSLPLAILLLRLPQPVFSLALWACVRTSFLLEHRITATNNNCNSSRYCDNAQYHRQMAPFLNGEVVRVGFEADVDTPLNQAVIELLASSSSTQQQPQQLPPGALAVLPALLPMRHVMGALSALVLALAVLVRFLAFVVDVTFFW